MRVACVQIDVAYGDPQANAAAAAEKLGELAARNIDLAIFPECFLTGYCVDDAEEAARIELDAASLEEALKTIEEACQKGDIGAIVGYAGRDESGGYNGAVLIEPGRPNRIYKKVHLPCMGLDKHVEPGHDLPVFDTQWGRIGILICFDMRPPEGARVLALAGVDLIAVPTNWPEGAGVSAEHVCIARAAENKVFVATCNRVGNENGFRFIGLSKIISPAGKVLASAGDGPAVIFAEINLAEARQKRTVTIPGKYETEILASRRPELYQSLVVSSERSE